MMSKKTNILSVTDFLKKAENSPIVDVRTPAEFEKGHIPKAVNIPLFSNEERALVGTKYKRAGRESAVILGLECVAPRLATLVKRIKKISHNHEVLIHCWRGGMRSDSVAMLLNTVGIKAKTLSGGYKAYRRYIRNCFQQKANIVILGGMTGSGKTEILQNLKKLKQQVIDLEGIANHKGSAFGGLGQKPQPTNEQFENNLYEEWKTFNLLKPIWIEDESQSLGSIWINDSLFTQMRKMPIIKIELNKTERIKRLVKEYAEFEKNQITENILKISKRLGGQNVKRAIESLEKDDFETVADITLFYYDKAYRHSLEQRKSQPIFTVELKKDAPSQNAEKILQYYDELKKEIFLK